MNREELESQLWEYIDGTCSAADQHRISGLIATDEVWMQEYNELTALHTSIPGNLELDQPSMRFTQNVMDTIAKANIAPATKQYINKGIIKGIAAFFIIAIISMICYSFVIAIRHTTVNDQSLFPDISFELSGIFNSAFFDIFITINIVLALVFVDVILRRRKTIGKI